MAAPVMKMTVSGQQRVLRNLARELGPEMSKKAAVALTEAAPLVAVDAKRRVTKHTWHGTLASSVKVERVRVLPTEAWTNIVATAPQARSFSEGWYSKSGKQPPSEALIPWITSRGIESDPKKVASLAFVMARAFKGHVATYSKTGAVRQGYAFKPMHFLKNALRYTKIPVLNVLIERMKVRGTLPR